MIRTLAALFGPLFLLCGAALALLLRFLPPPAPLYRAVPALLLLFGTLAVGRAWGRRRALVAGGLCALAALVPTLAVWLRQGPPVVLSGPTSSLVPVTLQVPPAFRFGPLAEPRRLLVPPGFSIGVFAAGLESPRMLAFSPRGDLYVSLPRAGRVVILPDRDGNGSADGVQVFAEHLDRPHGLAFAGGDLVVAENARLLRLGDDDGDLAAERRTVLSADLPAGGGHWTRSVVVGNDGRFYVAAGSSCNVCIEDDARRAAVLRIPQGGGPARIHARGLRNSVGLAVHPRTGELWGSDNGRDMLGDDLPPEEINRIVAGGDYGWPACYGQRVPDPDFGDPQRCRETLPPEVEMQAHSAPLGITFGEGLTAPEHYRQMLYVAFHGSWNRSVPTGYKLIGIPFKGGRPAGPPEDVISGWLQKGSAWGRPVAPLVGPDGALYLSDDRAGCIYRLIAAPTP